MIRLSLVLLLLLAEPVLAEQSLAERVAACRTMRVYGPPTCTEARRLDCGGKLLGYKKGYESCLEDEKAWEKAIKPFAKP